MSTASRRRGFTLIELLITLAVTAVVMTTVTGALLAQQQLYLANARLREAQAQARQGLGYLERNVALTGYGLDPALGLDFNVYAGYGANCTPAGAAPPTAACVRDRTDGPDELVVHFRDPDYWSRSINVVPSTSEERGRVWRVTARNAAEPSVTLSAHGGEAFRVGTLLQLVCSGGAKTAYVRVAARAPAVGTASAGVLKVTLAVAEAGDPYNQPGPVPGGMTDACFVAGNARAFLVHRHRYYVKAFAELSGARMVSYLLLDDGTDRNNDGARDDRDSLILAEGVEDLQVSYLTPNGATPALPTRVASTTGTALSLSCGITARPVSAGICADGLRVIDFTADASRPDRWGYVGLSVNGPVRQSPDAANVTSIGIAITARAVLASKQKRGTPMPKAFNRDFAAPPPLEGYERAMLETIVEIPNLKSRGIPYL